MIGDRGRALVQRFEGCSLSAYKDSRGIWTIGWGRTYGVDESSTCSQEQADGWLMGDLADAASAVDIAVTVPLTEAMRDALASWTYNLGASRLMESTMLEMLNEGKYLDAAEQLTRWWRTRGSELGLLRRRLAEAQLFVEDGLP